MTRLPQRARAGDADAHDLLLPLLYDELHGMAARQLGCERDARTLQPTALLHEAWLRLDGSDDFDNRAHFFGAAAQAMRRVLIDHARAAQTKKRGAGARRITLSGFEAAAAAAPSLDLLALDEALDALADDDPRAAKVVELRFFAGLSGEDAARALGVSLASVNRDWAYARAWLQERLEDDGAG